MVFKGGLAEDPRGLIYEAFRIEGITEPECRTIFLDWALGIGEDQDSFAAMQVLEQHYARDHPTHPMLSVIREGLNRTATPKRRRGRSRRS